MSEFVREVANKTLGGEGSGFFDHAGRPGEVGGSTSEGAGQSVEMYHGTTSERLQGIIKEGIQSGKFKNWSENWYYGRENQCFVTKNEDIAEYFAREAWRKAGGGFRPENKPIILKARIPVKDWVLSAKRDVEVEKESFSYTIPEVKSEWLVSYKDAFSGEEKLLSAAKSEFIEIYIPVTMKGLELLKAS